MSLTYSQKQFVQKNYPSKTIEEIAKALGVSHKKVQKHIDKNSKFFSLSSKSDTEERSVELFQITNFKTWLKSNWINLLTLFIFVLIAYANAFGAEFVSDDIQTLVEKESDLQSGYYVSERWAFFARSIPFYISYHIAGLTPFAFRIINILFHIGNVWLVYILTPYFFRKQMVAFIAAALFAVHPMMIESVTWISGGIYAQAAFSILVSFYLYLIAREKNNPWVFLSLSALFFIFGLSVSEKIIVYPILLFFYEIILGNIKKTWKYQVLFFATSIFWGLFVVLAQLQPRIDYLQRTNGTEKAVQFYNPFIQIPVALAKYAQLYFWPFGNTLYHSEFRMDLLKYLNTLIISVTLFILYIVSFKKNKNISFLLTFFIISLVPTMNPFGLSWIVAERYVYFGSISLFMVIAFLINKIIESKQYKTIGYIILTFIILGLTVRTIWRNSEWQNVDTLWVATGKTSPSDPKTHNNLGDMYARHGEMDKAVEAFSEAIRLNPNYAAAWYNRGNTYKHLKNDEEALKNFQAAVEKDPTIWQGYMNIAVIQFNKQEYDAAEENLNKALKLNPENPSLYANLGVVYLTKGNKELALEYLNKALQIDPNNAFAQEWLQKAQSVE